MGAGICYARKLTTTHLVDNIFVLVNVIFVLTRIIFALKLIICVRASVSTQNATFLSDFSGGSRLYVQESGHIATFLMVCDVPASVGGTVVPIVN